MPSADRTGHVAVLVTIKGRVQGVWFRGWTVDNARALGLDGWVRNRRDGTVEALISGPPEAVRRMIRLFQDGPPLAHVEQVDTAYAAPTDESGFEQRSTD